MESSIETNKEPQYSVEVVGMEQAEGDYDNGFQAGEVDVISPPSSESLPAYENEPLHDHTNQPSFNPQAFIQREGELLVETYFGQGSLGVTLRRNADTGIVFVFDIVPNSQAVHIDVQPGDELWSVGEYDIGRTPLDKDAWKGLIDFIKESQRPLRMVWVRRPYVPKAPPTAVDPSSREALPMKEVKEAHSYEYIQLEKLLARLVQNKDQKQNFLPAQSTKRPTDWTATLLQEGRHILRQGDLQAILKGSGSRKPTVKRIILLSDMILVTTPQAGNMLSVDHVIEIITCKVRSIGQVFGGERKNITDHGSAGLDASFELLWPGGEMQLMAESKEIREVWVVNIYLAICECVPQESRVLGWRHQYLLGTIHSAVLSRDEGRIRELVSFCEAGLMDYLAIDTPDEDGFTPLHYACMLRMQNIVRILHEATADVTATDRFGFTALHWSAIHLDAASLDMLCSHVFDIDLHDKQGRTPLVLACLEGRNGADKLDPHALRDCLKIMLTHKPDVSYRNSIGETLVHLLAGSWQFEALEQIIEAGVEDMSIAELTSGMTALHYAVLGDLTKALPGEGTRIMNLPSYNNPDQHNTEPTSIDGVETLHTLIKCGAKVQIKDSLGRTALTLLLDPAQADKWALDDLEAAVITLISSGSRMDESNVATIKARFPSINATALQDKWAAIPPIDCSRLDVRVNQFEPLSSSEDTSASSSLKSDPTKGTKCRLCSVPFTMFRRNHHCRLCNILCCDDCSKKRCVIDNAQNRCCDPCFNRVLCLDEKFKAAEMLKSIRPLAESCLAGGLDACVTSPVSPSFATGQTEREKKESLFGFSFTSDTGKKSLPETQGSRPAQTVEGVSATMGVMNETHDKLLERGEKLSRVQDKTEEMANQASEFARLARQLNEQQKSRWF